MPALSQRESPEAQARSDEALCVQAKQGDAAAADLLIGRYTSLIDRRARRMSAFGLEPDDLRQEGLIGLLRAIRGFDAGRAEVFAPYAARCIVNRMASALKAQQNGKRLALADYLPLDEAPEAELGREEDDPQDLLVQKEERQVRLRYVSDLLSDFERRALGFYLSGRSYDEIAVALRTTTKAVDNALARVRRKLKPHR